MAASITGDTPPPQELKLGWRCKDWRCLPATGGYLDQPLYLMRRIEYALDTYEAFSARERAESAVEFAEKHPKWAEFCHEVESWDD